MSPGQQEAPEIQCRVGIPIECRVQRLISDGGRIVKLVSHEDWSRLGRRRGHSEVGLRSESDHGAGPLNENVELRLFSGLIEG